MYELKNMEFKKTYDELCSFHDRLTIFSDFVKMCAISIYNSFAKNEELENEYLRTINSYNKKGAIAIYKNVWGIDYDV